MLKTLALFSQTGNLLCSEDVTLENGDTPEKDFVESLYPDFRVSENSAGYVLRPRTFGNVTIPDEAILDVFNKVTSNIRVAVADEDTAEEAFFQLTTDEREGSTLIRIVDKLGNQFMGVVIDPTFAEGNKQLVEQLYQAADIIQNIIITQANKDISDKLTVVEQPFKGEETFSGPGGEEPTPAAEAETLDEFMSAIVAKVTGLRYRGSFDSGRGDPWDNTYHYGDVVVRDNMVCVNAKGKWFNRQLSANGNALVSWLTQFTPFVNAAPGVTEHVISAMGFIFQGEVDGTDEAVMNSLTGPEWSFWLTKQLVVIRISNTFINYRRNDPDVLTSLLKIAAPGKFKPAGATPSSNTPEQQARELVSQLENPKSVGIKVADVKGSDQPQDTEAQYAYLDFALDFAPANIIYRYLFQGPAQQLLESGFVEILKAATGWQSTVNLSNNGRQPVMLIERDDTRVMGAIFDALSKVGLRTAVKPIRQAAHMAVPKKYLPLF